MNSQGSGINEDVSFTLNSTDEHAVAFPINTQVAMRCEALGEGTGLGIGEDGDPAYTLQSAHSHAVAFHARQDPCPSDEHVGAIDTDGTSRAVAFYNEATLKHSEEICHTLRSRNTAGGVPDGVMRGMQVRRLTPTECARLQGFPDDYLDIEYRGKPASDGPKYKALGNSMAVPCMRWIGSRILTSISESAAADFRDTTK